MIVWRVAELCTGRQKLLVMPVTHKSNMFTAVFSCDNAYIYSGGESLFVAASDVKAGRPGRFWYVRLHQVDTNVTSANEKNVLVHLSDATSMPARL